MAKSLGAEAHKIIKDTLEQGDWNNGYQFRHSDYFFLKELSTKLDSERKTISVLFRVEYKTKAHLVYNDVKWIYPYEQVTTLAADMEDLERQILTHTSDPDRTDQVFGKRFNQKLFEERNYESKGWVIKR